LDFPGVSAKRVPGNKKKGMEVWKEVYKNLPLGFQGPAGFYI